MSALTARAEILKLVRALREQLGSQLLYEESAALKYLVAVTAVLPPQLLAIFGQRLFGAQLCARIASQMPPARAIAVAGHLGSGFLAEICVALEPQRAGELVAALPPERVAQIVAVLLGRGEFVTMSRLLEGLGERTLQAALDQIHDNEALLRIVAMIDAPGRVKEILGLLPNERLRQVMVTAVGSATDLWPKALRLMSRVDGPARRQLGEVVAEQEGRVLDNIIGAVQRGGLWPSMLPLLAGMGEQGQGKLLARPLVQTPEVIQALIAAAVGNGLWQELAGLMRSVGEPVQRELAKELAGAGETALRSLVSAMARPEVTSLLLPVVLRLNPDSLRLLAKLIQTLPAPLAAQLERQLLLLGTGTAVSKLSATLLGRK